MGAPNKAADALSSMAARFAKGGYGLGNLVRLQQDLLAARQAAYASLDVAASKGDMAASELARAHISSIGARLTVIQEQLAKQFPAYAELSSPRAFFN